MPGWLFRPRLRTRRSWLTRSHRLGKRWREGWVGTIQSSLSYLVRVVPWLWVCDDVVWFDVLVTFSTVSWLSSSVLELLAECSLSSAMSHDGMIDCTALAIIWFSTITVSPHVSRTWKPEKPKIRRWRLCNIDSMTGVECSHDTFVRLRGGESFSHTRRIVYRRGRGVRRWDLNGTTEFWLLTGQQWNRILTR